MDSARSPATDKLLPETRPGKADPGPDESDDRQSALARGLAVIEAFRDRDDALNNAELAALTGLPKATVSRICATLLQSGYLRRDEQGRFGPAVRLLTLAYPVLRGFDVRRLARPLMMELAAKIQGPVSLVAMDGLHAVAVESAHASAPHPIEVDIGMTAPLIQTSVGRALLWLLDEDHRQQVLDQSRLRFPALFERFEHLVGTALDSCRQRGFCVSLGDFHPSVHHVAVPLYLPPEGPPLALLCGVATFRLGPGGIETDVAPRALGLADAIRASSGYAAPIRRP